ncbi:MAG TPA: hypothetical protein DCG19_10810 [Cryomorphaceae bacterium]|nr:hypothetical protein [Owenweeksia sp.]HAD97886.1 hypothetical protein [Cryomorphaceae bacterium]HCQ15199.1 hypothetical protein [Cryomorphaceae bacterium]|tara:strand:- start:178 stop:402 length:225 start_codon:yes stop_codon:yes gene_type:complete
MNTLEYHQAILKRVSFDESLLKKELEKTVNAIAEGEQAKLIDWCKKELDMKWEQIATALVLQKKFKVSQLDKHQ